MMEKVSKLLDAEGYALTSADVDRGTHSVVYHCRTLRPPPNVANNDDNAPAEGKGPEVRVKVLNESLPLPRHLTNLQQEHKIVAALMAAGVPGIVHVLARLSRPGLEALVLEDFGGHSLDQWLARDGPMASDMDTFLMLALTVARTLGHVHRHSVVHRDIKVHNPHSTTSISI
jgi:serine/threonine protein kinase